MAERQIKAMAMSKRYIITKKVMGNSLKDVLKKERSIEPDSVNVDDSYEPPKSVAGFTESQV